MITGPSVFFQIAAALIPALVLAGWLSDAAKPERLFRGVPRFHRRLYLPFVACVLALAVLAEFFAISEAVAGHSVPSALHTVLVADAIALSTVLLALALFLPWLKSANVLTHVIYGITVVTLLGSFGGGVVLDEAVVDAIDKRSLAVSYCLRQLTADQQREFLDAEDRIASATRRITTTTRKIEQARRKPDRSYELKRLRSERKLALSDLKGANVYLRVLVELAIPPQARLNPDEYVTSLGC